MKRSTLALAAALCLLPLSAMAHKQWLVPSSTVVAGTTPSPFRVSLLKLSIAAAASSTVIA